jgi:hypothetical protein
MKDEKGGLKDVASRTREFAVNVVRLYSRLPKSTEAQVIGKQVSCSGTPVYLLQRSEPCTVRCRVYQQDWFELLRDAGLLGWEAIALLDREADELTAILVSMVKKRKKESV